MKKIKYILCTILASAIFLNLLFISSARAADYLQDASFIALPAETTAPANYLNSTSTSFRVHLELASFYKPDELRLYLDNCASPLDYREVVDASDYDLDSRENSLLELKTLLASCSLPAEGEHTLRIEGVENLIETTIWQQVISADFTSSTGIFSAINPEGKTLLKVGDQVEITYNSIDTDIDHVAARIYDRELIWQEIGGKFIATYELQEGNLDQAGTISLSGVTVYDKALNLANYGNLNFPVLFSIDASSPTLSILNPENGKTYSSRNLSICYSASGYDSIEFYLDGILLPSIELNNLVDGIHKARVVVRDLAGNVAVSESNFSVDTTAPAGSVSGLGGEITEGDPLEFSGITESGASVIAEIAGNSYATTADKQGKFSFSIKNLKTGSYDVYLTLVDLLGNKSRFFIGNFSVKAKPETFQVASANNIVYDSGSSSAEVSKITLPKISEDEPFAIGRINSAGETDGRLSMNYGSWLILGAIILFSIFLSAISYNIYSRIVTAKALDVESDIIGGEYIKEESIVEAIKEQAGHDLIEKQTSDQSDSVEPPLRW